MGGDSSALAPGPQDARITKETLWRSRIPITLAVLYLLIYTFPKISVIQPLAVCPAMRFLLLGRLRGARRVGGAGAVGEEGSMDRGSWEKRWREGHLFPLLPKLWQQVRMVRVTERDSESPDSPFVGGRSPSWGQAVVRYPSAMLRPIEPAPPGPLVRWVDAV